MKKVKSFKEFINESVWADIYDRSTGETERKEDIIGNTKTVKELADKVINELFACGFNSDFEKDTNCE